MKPEFNEFISESVEKIITTFTNEMKNKFNDEIKSQDLIEITMSVFMSTLGTAIRTLSKSFGEDLNEKALIMHTIDMIYKSLDKQYSPKPEDIH